MYSITSMLDTIQNIKKTMTNKVISDPELNKLAHDFMDAQLAFAKTVVAVNESTTKYWLDKMTKVGGK